jgi:ferredoxin
MPTITVDNQSVTIPEGKRLVLALLDEAGIDQLHACGGVAKCTTCRVQFIAGEPTEIAAAEATVLKERGLTSMPGVRLSCQIVAKDGMVIQTLSRMKGSGRSTPGARPKDAIEPEPVWETK